MLALPSIPLSALGMSLTLFLPEFYSGSLGVNLSVVGTVFMVVRLLDIFYDPLVGALMDRTRTRWGQFKPWLAAGVPVTMAGVAMLFLARPGVGAVHLGFWLLIAYAGWSTIWLAQLALTAGQTPDYDERSRVFGWSQGAYQAGTVIVMLLPLLLRGWVGNDGSAVMMVTAWVIVTLIPVATLPLLVSVKEPADPPPPAPRAGVGDYLALLGSSAVRVLLAVDLVVGLGVGVAASVFVIFFMEAEGFDRSQIGLCVIGQMTAALLATPLVILAARRFGKHRVLTAGALFCALGLGSVAFAPPNLLVMTCILSVSATGNSICILMPRAMMADVSDEIRLAGGADRTGLLYSLLMGTWKVGQALAVGVAFISLDLLGYSRTGGGDPSQRRFALVLLYCGVPAVLASLGALIAFSYPLTAKRFADIRGGLARLRRETG
ncbi:MAG: hypothetical protein JWO33_987 [Caulobacteraceae bacterium]|nr:hypothetical protein [Caulobacteraceae bacterium]